MLAGELGQLRKDLRRKSFSFMSFMLFMVIMETSRCEKSSLQARPKN